MGRRAEAARPRFLHLRSWEQQLAGCVGVGGHTVPVDGCGLTAPPVSGVQEMVECSGTC